MQYAYRAFVLYLWEKRSFSRLVNHTIYHSIVVVICNKHLGEARGTERGSRRVDVTFNAECGAFLLYHHTIRVPPAYHLYLWEKRSFSP